MRRSACPARRHRMPGASGGRGRGAEQQRELVALLAGQRRRAGHQVVNIGTGTAAGRRGAEGRMGVRRGPLRPGTSRAGGTEAGTRPGQAAASPGRGRGAVGGWDQQG